jgi:hypothetical protein
VLLLPTIDYFLLKFNRRPIDWALGWIDLFLHFDYHHPESRGWLR